KTYKGKKLQKLQVESRMHKYITRIIGLLVAQDCYLQHAIITFTCYSSKKNLFKKKNGIQNTKLIKLKFTIA
ncbi:hypothetical protein ACJX0J_009525, partial [Zea mays]